MKRPRIQDGTRLDRSSPGNEPTRTESDHYLSATDALIPTTFGGYVRFALKKYGLLGSAARYLLMRDEIAKFVASGTSDEERIFRRELVRKFNIIQKGVTCAHSPYQFILMARYVLASTVPGPIVQCGAFKGGSSAKLSLVAARSGRRLFVCDSFAGLPDAKNEEELHLRGHDAVPSLAFKAGEYAGTLSEVRDNVARFGAVESCEFVPGLFEKSLPHLDVHPAVVFIDVDYVSSARDCLKYLWPRLAPGGFWFTHEAAFPDYVRGILDSRWWHENLGECPPVIIGARSGLSPLAEYLAYFEKPTS